MSGGLSSRRGSSKRSLVGRGRDRILLLLGRLVGMLVLVDVCEVLGVATAANGGHGLNG